MSVNRLAKRLKAIRPKESELSDLVYGLVVSISPLKIKVEKRFEIDSEFIELSQLVRNLSISFTIDGKKGTAQVFRALQVGDKVRMIQAQKSQKFYVLERV
ncbi:DUF2577 family protein [Listeria monocytogenes]|uniref:DUF2577 family protein n=1 Tax=Listeria monocytogenes TaxID=1639 RepID=UPI000F1B5E88|nr:DUF2577 family protein [Listeria monocytogenes]EAC8001229.1 DUF2577 domain-containing protein [Listeria monocytogenes]EJC6460079.1 DUF2577 family protein [Listeria monocytogenes]EJT8453799.1 DUF2577 family protein [Listeria monocytogenes]MCM64438.1 hypothetical protein [Listeria monocytogenes]TYU82164.1 DUF2577 domain-containing protein [Listeria monocytogenes]